MIFDKSVLCPVLIGRENDLQRLARLMSESQESRGQIALISGEAGIGKSRLVREVKRRAPEGTLILEGYCFQTDSTLPYAPLLDLFRHFFGTHPREEIARLMAASGPELGRLFPELTLYLPDLAPAWTPGPEPEQEKRRLFQALAQTLTELAQRQPLIVILEDLHWSDSTSLEFLLLLARRISSQPMLLLLTYRSEDTTPELAHFLAELDRERLSTEFALQPMSSPDVQEMLQAILDTSQAPLSREFLDTLVLLTEGNPFFIEEILKALVSGGDISYANGSWDRKEINPLHIPRTVQDAVQRRTQQLDEGTLQALTLASVMGRRFDFRLLQELLNVDEAGLMRRLKELIAAQLVMEETADQFAFRHALTREAIYNTLLLRERQGLHRSVAEAIERLYTGALDAHVADLSFHFYTGGDWQKALAYSRRAGDQARAFYAQREAVVYYSRAIVSARQLKLVIEPELLGARGHAYEILGDFKSALDDFEHALRIARQKGDGHAEWQTLTDLGFIWAGRDYQRTGEFFRQAEELARNLNEPKLLAHSLNRMGHWYFVTGKTTQALACHRQALEFFEGERDEPGMAETRDTLGMAMLHHGDQIGSYEQYQHAIRLLRKLDDKPTLISALIGASHSLYDETDFVPSQSRLENQQMSMEALELARQVGWAGLEAFAEWGLALGLAHWGMFVDAIAHAKAMFRIAMEIDNPQRIIGAYYAFGYIYVLMLQADLAIQNLEAAFSLTKKHGSAWLIGNTTAELVSAYLLNGDTGRARALLDSVLQEETGYLTRAERRMLWAKGNLLLAEKQPAEALRIAEHLLDSKRSSHAAQPIPALLKLKGEALFALKQFKKAERSLEQAKQGAEQREALPLLWQIQRSLGWLYKEQKNNEKAEREFASARRVLQTLAANIEDEQLRADFLQAALETLPKERKMSKRESDAATFGGLTPREREVAHFLSQGKSNREIAEALVLSERTVENHVGNILTKLGFDSRAQIAVWAVEKGLGKEGNQSS
jgi:DNA-binding CsgD family transcriptional regulator/tetratricopeptide (TPR) repeat protein